MNANCLTCHSGKIDGELVIGLGNATADFTGGLANGNTVTGLPDELMTQLGLTEAEKSNLDKLLRVSRAFGPETIMRTIGQNPAESFTGVLLAHHDPVTLEWSEEPLRPIVIRDEHGNPIEEPRLTSDPPPVVEGQEKERPLLQRHGTRRPSRHDGARHGCLRGQHPRGRARRRAVRGHAGVHPNSDGSGLQRAASIEHWLERARQFSRRHARAVTGLTPKTRRTTRGTLTRTC